MRHLCIAVLVLPLAALADERILSFHSDVLIFADSTIEVTETIVVQSEGKEIRRGIYRDFPVEYENKRGDTVEISVQPLVVLRNGAREDFHSRRFRRDLRTYFGHKDRLLPPGVHTYVFRYRANRMLGYFDEHDELYWNVTGFRWLFPIDVATATVRLDFNAPVGEMRAEGYTGPNGSRAQEYTRQIDADGQVHFRANAPLSAANGLTIVVGWPKGFVEAPTVWQKLLWLLTDNRNLVVAGIGFFLLLLYYLPVWSKVGKNPDAGPVVTRYEPPTGFSPASLRYIRQMYYDDKVMTAAVVNLAVKGYLEIDQTDDAHVLRKKDEQNATAPLAAGERELYDALFAGKHQSVTLKQFNHKVLGKARAAHAKSLKADYKNHYFRTNGIYNIPAVVIVLATTLISVNTGNGATSTLIGALVLLYATMSFFAIIMRSPTPRGRKLLDEMLGFKDYLQVAEEDELNLRNPPEKTPQLFEVMLPFALALGVDQDWSERFSNVLASVRGDAGGGYSPNWYSGDWNNASLSTTTAGLTSSLNSAISSSVTAPGSSSGGGGGGSSGGGGGGGGGGGW